MPRGEFPDVKNHTRGALWAGNRGGGGGGVIVERGSAESAP